MRALTTLPRLQVEAHGRAVEPELLQGLDVVLVQQRLGLPSLCELVFRDRAGLPLVAASLTPGAPLQLAATNARSSLFRGEVTAVEYVYGPDGEHELRVRGYDLLHRLRKRQTVRMHVDLTVVDLAREMVADFGLSVSSEAAGPVWPYLVQHRQSDLDLLSMVAARCGLYPIVRGSTLHLATLEGQGEGVHLRLGETLLETRIEVNADPACRTVHATGWNPLTGTAHTATATAARTGRAVAATAAPGEVGASGERYLVDLAVHDDAQIDAEAQAELDRRIAREVTLRGVAEGDPDLQPGVRVHVSGVAPVVEGRYVLTAVTHTIDEHRGFISEFDTAPPEPRRADLAGVLTIGVVTRVGDPEGAGRVRVRLAAYGDIESPWLQVLAAGAGAGKGLVALPDSGDRVLVLFPRDDPGQGVVLGGLFGMDGPPDAGVESEAIRRYTLLTPGGQRIRLDDVRGTMRLENHEGSYLELSPEEVQLHATTDLTISAPGRAVSIRARTVDFERADEAAD